MYKFPHVHTQQEVLTNTGEGAAQSPDVQVEFDLSTYCGGRPNHYPLDMYLIRALPESAVKQEAHINLTMDVLNPPLT